MRRTKIVATIGPATGTEEAIKRLILAGANVLRLNFSHGTHEEHGKRIDLIRKVAKDLGIHVGILQDLQGPKIRVGNLREPVHLEEGQKVEVAPAEKAKKGQIPVSYGKLLDDIRPGERILIADGRIELIVLEEGRNALLCEVRRGGEVSSRKGVNFPDSKLSASAMTEKDRKDLEFGLKRGVDFVALSFVSSPEDIWTLERAMMQIGKAVPIIAKIERKEAVKNADSIIDAADGIMVARGDLGVEIPLEEVPIVQKRLVKTAVRKGKFVIVATQMLETMVSSPTPTRAEIADIANAILDGADALMLSEETATGSYPVEAVKVMASVATETEKHYAFGRFLKLEEATGVPAAIGFAATHLAERLGAKAIISATHSGFTARMVSRFRPKVPIVATTPFEESARRLSIVWGVYPVLIPQVRDTDLLMEEAVRAAKAAGYIRNGDTVIIIAGVPVGISGTTNLIRVYVVEELVARGRPVTEKTGTLIGKVAVVSSQKDAAKTEDRIVVAKRLPGGATSDMFKFAKAIVVEEIDPTAVVIGVELNIPVLVETKGILEKVKDGEILRIDLKRGTVHKG